MTAGRTTLAVLLATAATACSPSPAPIVDAVDAHVSRLEREVTDVAEAQAATDAVLVGLLTSIRGLDAAVVAMRSPETLGAGVEAWAGTAEGWPADGADPVRERLVGVAAEVDEARVALNRARAELSSDWERSYLDAQDDVLRTVRVYAEEADRLVQVIGRHWDLYSRLFTLTDAFVDRRGFFRSDQEAVQAYEVDVGGLTRDLATAQDEIRAFARVRDDAARAVNAASDVAADVWSRRPQSDG